MPPSTPPRTPATRGSWRGWEFWGAAFGVFTLLGLVRILSVVGSIRAQTCPLAEGMVVSFTLFDYYLWMLLTPAMFFMAGRAGFEPGRRLRALGLHALAAATLGLVHLVLLVVLYVPYNQRRLPRPGDLPLGMKLLGSDQLYMGVLVYGVTVTVALVLHHRRQQALAASRAAALEAQLAQAELTALRMQLQPHFLFNTLHTIGSLVDEAPAVARSMTARLGDFLRLTLESSRAPEVPLRQELAFLHHYLAIEQVRFGPRLVVVEEVDPALLEAKVPNFILQPLVENALRHGLASRELGGRITLRAQVQGETLRLQVEDTGRGLVRNPALGVGLGNVVRRLAHLHGPRGRFTLEPGPEGGACATVTVPLCLGEGP